MAAFTEKEIVFSDINGGQQYINGQTVDAKAINAPIQASAWAQKKAKEAHDIASNAKLAVQNALGGKALESYPVGSIYMSTDVTSPASIFGGTWTRIEDRFLLAAGTKYPAGGSGGSASSKIDYNNLPPLSVCALKNTTGNSISKGGQLWEAKTVNSGNFFMTDIQSRETFTNVAYNHTPLNTMPPYLTVYMWRRTA